MYRAICALALLAVGATAAIALAAEGRPIRATQLRERQPVAGGGYLAWSQGRRRSPAPLALYARRGRGRPFRISRRGSQAFAGSISGTTLVYQENSRNSSDIRFYDLQRRRHVATPRGVNTTQWEWRPSLSGSWLVFSRHNGEVERLYLYDLRSGEATQLDSGRMDDGRNIVFAGQVNGNFLVWEQCRTRVTCMAIRYDLSTRLATPIPAPVGRVHYAPSVAGDGTVYLGRSAPRCGVAVELWRYPIVGAPQRLFALPRGFDFGYTYAVSRPPGPVAATDIYYERARCVNSNNVAASDLYRYTVVVRPTP